PIGIFASTAARVSGLLSKGRLISVANGPGQIALMQMPCLAHSRSRVLVSIVIPPLLDEYGVRSGMLISPSMLETLITRPQPRCFIGLATARQHSQAPLRFVSITSSHWASVRSSIGPRMLIPALLT